MKITRESLKEQIEIIDSTFEKLNLQVIGVGISSLDEKEGWFNVIVELITINGEELDSFVDIKVNIYDDNGIVLNDSLCLDDGFNGYDTITIQLQEDNIAFISKSIRLFATKS